MAYKSSGSSSKDTALDSPGTGSTTSSISEFGADDECPVCLECFQDDDVKITMSLPCRHLMCKDCSVACNECPLCRCKIEGRVDVFA